MKIRPLFDKILVTIKDEDSVSKGGILLIDLGGENSKDKQVIGDVIAVGGGKVLPDGTVQTPEVKEGDQILFLKGSGIMFKLDDQDYYFIKEEDVFGVL